MKTKLMIVIESPAWLSAVLLGIVAFVSPSQELRAQSEVSQLSQDEVRTIAREAYIYGFPLVDNYRVLHSYFVEKGGSEYKAPWNQIHHETRVFTHEDKTIQTANSDTPYSQIGTDLRVEPLVITVPKISKDRYYSLQFIDLYTFNYAYVGSRATGNDAGSFLLVGPSWKGETPAGIKQVIPCESELGWVLLRTQLFDPADIVNVKKVQAGFKVQTLSAFLGRQVTAQRAISFINPLRPELQKTSIRFFDVLNFALQYCPPHPSEKEVLARFAKIGIGYGKNFQSANLNPSMSKAFEEGMQDAWAEFAVFKRTELDTGKRPPAEGW
jgi:hypothetical protein